MPSSSSKKSIVFGRRLAAATLTLHDGPRGPVRNRPRHLDLKEIQRRAFERGQAVEREKGSRALAAVCAAVETDAARRRELIESDRVRVEEFAVRLSLAVAEKLTYRILDAGEHDVAGMVRQLLLELGAGAGEGALRLRLSPNDHGLVLEAAARGEIGLESIEALADPAVKPGGAALEGEDVEYWSALNDRIERVRDALLEEVRHV